MYRRHTDDRLLPAFDAFESGNLNDAKSLAGPFLQSTERQLRVQASVLFALTFLRGSDTRGALAALDAVYADDNKEALALHAICALRLGSAESAHRTFARAVDLERGTHGFLTHDHVFLYTRECRRAREWSEFWRWLAVLLDAYAALGITDTSFLGLREVPPFESAVAEAEQALAQGAPPPPDRTPWNQLAVSIDPEGRAALEPLFKRLGWEPTPGA